MATVTLTSHANDDKHFLKLEPRARTVRSVTRKMADKQPRENIKFVDPPRTTGNPSPVKPTGANRQPGQSNTRATVDEALNRELARARIFMDDLADHVFGHIVTTEFAKDVLAKFIDIKLIEVRSTGCKNALDPDSDDVQCAIQQAFEEAVLRDCRPRGADSNNTNPRPTPADSKEKGKQQSKTFSFKWTTFPDEPINEDKLVTFLNNITDEALDFAKSKLPETNAQWRHRFAAPIDKHHAFPLSYEPDGEDMRPDFVLLPREAFKDDKFKTVDPRYINFTATRLVGEVKNKNLAAGLEQVHRYARGLKRAQPWVHYVLALTITKSKAVLLRGDNSGTEGLELMLTDGRGCIEFIRILLGLALADEFDLGQNPDVQLEAKLRSCEVRTTTKSSILPNASGSATTSRPTSTVDTASRANRSFDNATCQSIQFGGYRLRPRRGSVALSKPSRSRGSSLVSNALASASHNTSASQGKQTVRGNSTSSKRAHSELGDDDYEVVRSKKPRTEEAIVKNEDHMVFVPLCVYGNECLGILFTSSSIRGRGTTVFCVLHIQDAPMLCALKMSWQDLERVRDLDIVMERLRLKENHHNNVIVPFKIWQTERNGGQCTTLNAIRGFLDQDDMKPRVENRVLTISLSELKRPVKYFWGVHDFVRGLHGALLGHQHLTKIGVLHRDISENNIVLARRPGKERGYLIDFDMAILQEAESPTPHSTSVRDDLYLKPTQRNYSPMEPNETVPIKGLRTGTFPYISSNVLSGGKHTQFDDVESFLYVLFFFFFSYAGPLPKTRLLEADENGFVQTTGSGRLSHMRTWPKEYAAWADGDAQTISHIKYGVISGPTGADSILSSDGFQQCLKENWPEELHFPIQSLIYSGFKLFRNSTLEKKLKCSRTEVSHGEFIDILDKWLTDYSHLENEYSNCPEFKPAEGSTVTVDTRIAYQ